MASDFFICHYINQKNRPPCTTRTEVCLSYGKQAKHKPYKKSGTNKHKAKGLGQAFFPKGLRVSRGQSHLVAVRRQRNPFAND